MTEDNRCGTLGPGELATPKDSPFLLNQQEWYAIQRYVTSVLALPDTESKMRFNLAKVQAGEKIAYIGPFEEFKNLLLGYQAIIPHVAEWKDTIYPKTIELAQDISNYALKAEQYYGALLKPIEDLLADPDDQAAKNRFQGVCNNLSREAAACEKRAQAVYKDIQGFAENTRKDEIRLKELAVEYEGKFGKHSAAMEAWNKEAATLAKEIDDLNKDYEYACIVAKTTPTYAWIVFWVALIVASVYGDRAAKLKHDMDVKRDRIAKLGEDTERALVLTSTLSVAIQGLSDIQKQIAAALPCIQKIENVWKAIGGQLTKIGETIQKDIVEEDEILKDLGVAHAIAQWKDCKVKADGYQANALIKVPAEKKAA